MNAMTVRCAARLTPVLVAALLRNADRLGALSGRDLDDALRDMMVFFVEIENGAIVVRGGLRERFFDNLVTQ